MISPGKLLSNYVVNQNNNSTLTPEISVLTENKYDGDGRLLTVTKTINDEDSTQRVIATNTYDELGQLETSTLGDHLESLHYDYNIRGWLTGINKAYTQSGNTSHYFGMEMGYDKAATEAGTTTFTPMYNGNISGEIWKSKGDGVPRKYDFSYDNVNRLATAGFSQNSSGSTWNHSTVDFSVNNIDYDANGNITAMSQHGLKGGSSPLIDNLTYTYQSNSNQLQKVTDAANDPSTTLGDFHEGTNSGNDYSYDANGNLTKDLNKGISSMSYNYLNLPKQIIVFGNGSTGSPSGTIEFVYDAAGNKLQKVITDHTGTQTKVTTIDYVDGFLYKNDTLLYFPTENGRVRYIPPYDSLSGRFVYDYFIKDHLGNVRAVLTDRQLFNKYPAATLENNRVATEKNYYDISDGQIVPKNLTGATKSSFEDKLYRTNAGNNEKIGLGITLKVMAGDKVYIKAESFYQQPGGSGVGNPLPLLLSALAHALIGTPVVAAGKSITAGMITGNTVNATALTQFLQNERNPSNAQTPRAYLNWVLFDENFQFVAGGVDPVNPNGGYKLHTQFISNPVQITKNGYLFVYCSNESDINVFFDNLQLTHIQGHLQQEDTYYPFGMGIMALSSKAANGLQNGYKYNGIAEEDNFNLGLYAAYYRMLDPQLGRWWSTYPVNQFASPYLSMGNNPVNNVDPLGSFKTKFGAWIYKFFHGGQIQKSGITGEYFVGKPVGYVGKGIGVAYQRRFDWNGRNMPYLASGWGHTARSMIANVFNVNGQVSSLYELGWNSVLENQLVQFTGDLLERVKQYPAIREVENNIVNDVPRGYDYASGSGDPIDVLLIGFLGIYSKTILYTRNKLLYLALQIKNRYG